uniref:Transmembrane protein n=1 Tax=viral metagenome TaxID=1070528 RepID=A0A6C0JYI6_9ZZZZ
MIRLDAIRLERIIISLAIIAAFIYYDLIYLWFTIASIYLTVYIISCLEYGYEIDQITKDCIWWQRFIINLIGIPMMLACFALLPYWGLILMIECINKNGNKYN